MKYYLVILSILLAQNTWAQKRIIVAQDGSGDFLTVQAAFDAVPLHNRKPVTIFVKNGRYVEKLRLDSTRDFVKLVGEDRFETILSYNDHTGKISSRGDTINTYTSETLLVRADHFTAENICFENTAGFTAGQAVAVHAYGDKLIFRNCRFVGNQDVLFLSSARSRQFYLSCYIEGTTDFIFGPATAWFEKCHIHSKKNSHVTAASTPATKEFGFIFNDCVLTGDTALHNVSLGRPWRPFAHTVFMHSFIGEHIRAEGWANWNNTENYKTTRYAEYKNYGASVDPVKRIAWARQLTDEEAKKYTIINVFKDWDPR
jgi:pectinesterase